MKKVFKSREMNPTTEATLVRTKQAADRRPRSAAWQYLLAGVSLALYVFFIADLVLHPLSPSDGPALLGDGGVTFRYFSALAGTLNIVVGLLVMRRAPGNSLGVLLLVWGASAAGWSIRSDWSSLEQAGWTYLAFYFYFFGFAFPAITAFLYLYPTGHFYPRWVKPYALAALGLVSVTGAAANLALPVFGNSGIPNPIHIPWMIQNQQLVGIIYSLAMLLALLGPLLTLVVRYRQAGRLERQQIKWLVWMVAVVTGLSVTQSTLSSDTIVVQDQTPILQLFSFVIFILYQSMAAIACGIAILRHRLWDIDVVIRKTLVYSLLTGLLSLVYFGGVALLQGLLTADRGRLTAGEGVVGGPPSAVVIVVTTLAIAALFNPLRRRVQDFIDRRFYRQKYDAEKALSEFAASSRSETELDALAAQLTQTVNETIQPQKVSLWLVREKKAVSHGN
jgi:hypothetical protein